jgi:hypothetical protein
VLPGKTRACQCTADSATIVSQTSVVGRNNGTCAAAGVEALVCQHVGIDPRRNQNLRGAPTIGVVSLGIKPDEAIISKAQIKED